jgi:flagellar biosynthetic protein FliP
MNGSRFFGAPNVVRGLLLLLLSSLLLAVDAPPLTTVGGETKATQVEAPASVVTADAATAVPGQTVAVQGPPAPAALIQAPGLTVSLGGDGKTNLSTPVMILLAITALSVAPAFLMMMTSFTRIIIVLGFLRRALGTQTLPPNQVMAGLALFLSLFIMGPTLNRINATAVQPYLKDEISQMAAVDATKGALRDFMLKQTRKTDLALFIRLAGEERPKTAADVSFLTLVPAFMTSELKTAFQMGFIIFLPFLVIDLVVSAVLMALGMMMLPPVVVSLPFKILLFCLVDGWVLLMQALVSSYR